MLQRNITGYALVVQPPDGSHRAPFELAAGEEVDYPDPIAGCAAIPPGPDPEPAPDPKTTDPEPKTPPKSGGKSTKPDATADGGDPA
ncbi:hypothetical protein [Amycolatopsis sp. CFH S0078]|uniref:hypothetical protein n=1 Tax=Amycolatopsis sp. CFH S0078 TaxID=1644108 RepID=UPI00106EFB3B|nr:hypothetical protein [Amycolatopsis sp. CFH S0078]